jgi:NAD(P)-dependent dehydrogenase (short-subunit alcohol dehydrogenase family)
VASVLVAGGSSGIGLAAVRAFRARGDSVLLADLDLAAAQAVVAEDLPGPAQAMHCDLAQPDAPAAAVAAAVAFGGSLDVVFGNAGVLIAAPLAEWTVPQWDLSTAVNLRAPFLLAQASAPHLASSPIGSMIFTSSTGAFRGHAGMPAYAATKAGLVNLVRALDDPDAALDALVSAIPMRRQGTPEDVAGTVLFLASPGSAYVTGQALVVDGGYLSV